MTTVMDASKQREVDCTWLQYSGGPEGGVGRDHDVFQFWMKSGESDLIAYCGHGQEASDSRVRHALPNPDMPNSIGYRGDSHPRFRASDKRPRPFIVAY